MHAWILALLQIIFNGGVTINDATAGFSRVELTEATGCSAIWDGDNLGGGVVTLFDDQPEDHRVTDAGSCQPATVTLEEAEALSLP